ncbi:TPA_asm: hypothetical protein [Porphyromonas phage phage016a_WW2866]|uniref:Uncharacterized protein n=1 Tax=Porphyromonas phage phage016a_WW2866 TaxID=3154106 RepID=A0AAT9J8E7_9CAUD
MKILIICVCTTWFHQNHTANIKQVAENSNFLLLKMETLLL